MPASIYADSLYISTYILVLMWAVVAASIVLVNRRRHKLPFYYTPVIGYQQAATPNHHEGAAQAESYLGSFLPANERHDMNIAEELHQDLPDEWRVPSQAPAPDQIVIHIEPDGQPTPEQYNIQRIIKHLKSMSEGTTQVAS